MRCESWQFIASTISGARLFPTSQLLNLFISLIQCNSSTSNFSTSSKTQIQTYKLLVRQHFSRERRNKRRTWSASFTLSVEMRANRFYMDFQACDETEIVVFHFINWFIWNKISTKCVMSTNMDYTHYGPMTNNNLHRILLEFPACSVASKLHSAFLRNSSMTHRKGRG